jgi:hypothetical protein
MNKILLFEAIAAAGIAVGLVIGILRKPKNAPSDYSRFWDNLDKFLALGLVLICMSVAVLFILLKVDDVSVTWIENLDGQVVAGILAILGAVKVASRANAPTPVSVQETTKTVSEKTTVTPPDAAIAPQSQTNNEPPKP